MSKSPDEELEEFLALLPAGMQRALRFDYPWFDDPSISQEEKLEWIKNQDKESELRPKYEAILQRNPAKWNEYCRRAKQIDKLTAPLFRITPRGKPGRKAETELAQRIWKLQAEGKTVPQMQAIFKAEGQHFSKELIESYLKTRRRKPQE